MNLSDALKTRKQKSEIQFTQKNKRKFWEQKPVWVHKERKGEKNQRLL